jgi:hypothetical protein
MVQRSANPHALRLHRAHTSMLLVIAADGLVCCGRALQCRCLPLARVLQTALAVWVGVVDLVLEVALLLTRYDRAGVPERRSCSLTAKIGQSLGLDRNCVGSVRHGACEGDVHTCAGRRRACVARATRSGTASPGVRHDRNR